jgi:guanine deaminase
MTPEFFMREAIHEAQESVRHERGGPFGCVIVRRGEIIARGHNCVTSTNDPTAHAEIVAIRAAGAALRTFRLDDCELYTSCEPCPMCLAAMYWAHVPRAYFGATRAEAASAGFDDAFIYEQIPLTSERRTLPLQPLLHDEAQAPFRSWQQQADKVKY